MRRENILFAVKVLAVSISTALMFEGVRDVFSEDKTGKEAKKTEVVISQTVTATNETQVKQENLAKITESMESIHNAIMKDLDSDDTYHLAKLVMAEAEGEDIKGKALVARVVLNRVSNEGFPETIEGVIKEEHRGVHQFSVLQDGGRWWDVEPDEECYQAVKMVESGWDESQGALYFESRSNSAPTWHQENLDFLFQYGNHFFYKDKEE